MDATETKATYSAKVSRDATAKPGMEWGYELQRNGLRVSHQHFFSCAADAERYLRYRIAKLMADFGDTCPTVTIQTKRG